MSTPEPARGRGRPATMPPKGDRINLRCVVTAAEAEEVRAACEAAGLTQQQFTSRAVLWAARQVARKKPPDFLRADIDR